MSREPVSLTSEQFREFVDSVVEKSSAGADKRDLHSRLLKKFETMGVPDFYDQATYVIKAAEQKMAAATLETAVETEPIVEESTAPDAPEWTPPAHENVDLATADDLLMHLDPFANEADARLMDAIAEAKRSRADANAAPAELSANGSIVQPDAEGKFPTPLDGALWMASLGIPQTPLRPGTKRPFLPEWEQSATTDSSTVRGWAAAHAGCNFGSVAKTGKHFVFEADSPECKTRFEKTGATFTSPLIIQSRPGRGHRWYLYADGVTNISQAYTKHGDFSLRADDQQCVSPGSIHPETKRQYTIAVAGTPAVPTAAEIAFWNSERADKKSTDASAEIPKDAAGLIPHSYIHGAMLTHAGKLRNLRMDVDDIERVLLKWVHENCAPPIDESKVRDMARSMGKYDKGQSGDILLTQQPPKPAATSGVYEANGERLSHDTADEFSEASIPAFDPSVMKGIYKEIVDAVTRGTTLAPQYAYSIAKTIVGAKMAGNVQFEDLDVMPLEYLVNCGPTGAGKGEAWRRIYKIMTAKPVDGVAIANKLSCAAGIKVLNSADSGAGLRDAFFEFPDKHPIVCYIDETTSLGHKADGKKNPEIIDAMGELADSTSITRAKAKKSGKQPSVKTKDDAYLAVVMCAQNNEVLTAAFVGRTNVGWFDRLTPEYGVPQEPGNLPPIDPDVASRLLAKLNTLGYSGTMNTSLEATHLLHTFWLTLPSEVRTVARFKKHLKLDAYLMAFGRGVRTVEVSDMEDAIKIFQRQLAIRRVMFRGEVPNRIGFYSGLIKELTDWMCKRLAEGRPEAEVARSWRDYEKKTNARRNNEEDVFTRAMDYHAKHHLVKVPVKSKNGSVYSRYLPLAEDE